jgi:hypothetical protein
LSVDQFRDFIQDLTEAINSINFDYTPLSSPTDDPTAAFPGQSTPTCSDAGNNPLVQGDNPAATCLPQPPSDREDLLAQVFELCQQFELAIDWLASSPQPPTPPRTISQAFEAFATQFINQLGGANCTNTDCKAARGLLDCLRTKVIPLLATQTIQQQSTSQENQDSEIQMTNPHIQMMHPTQPTVSAFQQPEDSSIITQGTGDSSALEKVAKLKAQWLELLP